MAKVLVSFLGTGPYSKAKYCWKERTERIVEVEFAQTAILKFFEEQTVADEPVDRVIFFCTEKSSKQLPKMEKEMRLQLQTIPDPFPQGLLVPEDMTAANQWGWFEQLLENIDHGDTLIIDFTHGFRSVPIVFSSAIGFLRKAKDIKLAHALYAWWDRDKPDKEHPIIDMRDFYVIDDWAEAVSRLADEADARKLGDLAKTTGVQALQPLADGNLIKAFEEMTDCIRNVDVNNIGRKVSAALERVEQARNQVAGSAHVMLDLVWKKFSALATGYPPSGHYDLAYFQSQLEIIRVLLEHRLFMQAFTAMREMVGSIGMAGLIEERVKTKYIKDLTSSKGRDLRKRFAQVFIRMAEIPQDEWKFPDPLNARDKETLLPWYSVLEQAGIMNDILKENLVDMAKIRNGFDHAWTSQAEAQKDVEVKGRDYLDLLESTITQLAEHRLIS